MSSCISNSEAADAGARRWRGFVVAFMGAGLALLACLLGAVALLDPFDAGVFGEPHRGVADQAPRTADASRVRDPAFDAAVFGNSHIQLVDPAALSRGNGLAFASLTVPGTGPREQLAILDAFLRHHGGKPRALVFGIDPTWCVEDPALPITNPFPFWLYDPSPIAYLRGLARYAALEQAVRRIGLTIGLARPARRDGYWNYAVGRQPAYSAAVPAPADTPAETVIDDARRFPALDLLAERLAPFRPRWRSCWCGLRSTLRRSAPPVRLSRAPRPHAGSRRARCCRVTRLRRWWISASTDPTHVTRPCGSTPPIMPNRWPANWNSRSRPKSRPCDSEQGSLDRRRVTGHTSFISRIASKTAAWMLRLETASPMRNRR